MHNITCIYYLCTTQNIYYTCMQLKCLPESKPWAREIASLSMEYIYTYILLVSSVLEKKFFFLSRYIDRSVYKYINWGDLLKRVTSSGNYVTNNKSCVFPSSHILVFGNFDLLVSKGSVLKSPTLWNWSIFAL